MNLTRSFHFTVAVAVAMAAILAAAGPVHADDDVKITVNGQPAAVGILNRAAVTSIQIDNGLLAMTFSADAVGRIQKGNDSSIARDTSRSGLYQKNDFTFDAGLLKPGQNTRRLSANGGGLMYDTVVLEAD